MLPHANEPAGNKGVTINGRPITATEQAALRAALGIVGDGGFSAITAGTTVNLPYGVVATVTARDVDGLRYLDFAIPEGKPGLNGSGTMTVKRTQTLPYGQPANVVNEGTDAKAEYVFYIPQGAPGESLPAGAVENTYLGYLNGQYVWRTVSGTGTGGSTTIINSDAVFGAYPWEGAIVVTPPTTPAQTVMDATLYSAYQSAINGAPLGSKRIAGALAIINAMGSTQKLTMRRDGQTILVANYSGSMSYSTVADDIVVSLATLGAVSPIVAADNTTGTWTMEIAGGASFSRTITLPVTLDQAALVGDGFNPGTVSVLVPRSVDGL